MIRELRARLRKLLSGRNFIIYDTLSQVRALNPELVEGAKGRKVKRLPGLFLYRLFYYYVLSFVRIAIPGGYERLQGLQEYYYSRKKWFFAVLALNFVLDVGDTMIKGEEYMRHLSIEYPIRNTVHILLCLVAMRVNNAVFHGVLVIGFIVYELTYILRLFYSV